MKKLIIKSGDLFGNLQILEELYKQSNIRRFKVKCIKCGKVKISILNSIKVSKTGCKCTNSGHNKIKKILNKQEILIKKLKIRFYQCKQRCNNPKSTGYKLYGGRGIKCLWNSFNEFYRDMGKSYKEGLTLERIDVNGNYCKENCKWVTNLEQQRNKRNNIIIEGITFPEFCEKFSLNYKQSLNRYYRGYSISEIKENKSIIYKK